MSESRNRAVSGAIRSIARRGVVVLGVGALGILTACSPLASADGADEAGTSRDTLSSDNGMTPNGLTTNGLTTNGLTTNGLTTNGLTTNGLNAQAFVDWYTSSPPGYADMVMRYVTACALPRGRSLGFTEPNGPTHVWRGNLGLTPDWASGRPITEDEEQLVTACLAAHVNKFGLHVELSVRGANSHNQPIRLDPGEAQLYDEAEGCFFGNLFRGEGVYSGSDRPLNPQESSPRACGLTAQSYSAQECLPMVHVGTCQGLCTKDRKNPYYDRCTYNGKSYRVLTTKLRTQDVYRCGDGVCQFTENCGPGHRYDSCRADCGMCAEPH